MVGKMALQVWKCSGDYHWLCECARDMLVHIRDEIDRSSGCNHPTDENEDSARYECDGEDCLHCYLLRQIDGILDGGSGGKGESQTLKSSL